MPSEESQNSSAPSCVPTMAPASEASPPAGSWLTFLLGLASGLALWLAFPPVGWAWLAWVAPGGWVYLIRQPQLPGRRPYRALYLAGLLHWLLLTQWVRLPHWSAGIGWFFLAGYLAVFVPLFVGVSRVLVQRWRWSSVWAVPLAWVGCEYLRGRLFTGYALTMLGHTQVAFPPLLQIADCLGAYGVSFVVMLVAAAAERTLCQGTDRARVWWPTLVAVIVLGSAIAYGRLTIARQDQESDVPQVTLVAASGSKPTHPPASNRPRGVVRLALIQGSLDTIFGGDPRLVDEAFHDYIQLSRAAIRSAGPVDLVVWPESMLTGHWPGVSYEASFLTPEEATPVPYTFRDEFHQVAINERWSYRETVARFAEAADNKARAVTRDLGSCVLGGTEWVHLHQATEERYNSAVLLGKNGSVIATYRKMHPVMFGEYVPLGNHFPWLYGWTPMSGGLTPGAAPIAMEVDGVRLSPCICFENTVPHLIRLQVAQLASAGEAPDALVTITNDGWFWGSSLLDLHLACGIFRAVEHHRPMLIAANTGLSALIDGQGRLLARGPRRDRGFLVADVRQTARGQTFYSTYGDLFAGTCASVTLLAGVGGWWAARGGRHAALPSCRA